MERWTAREGPKSSLSKSDTMVVGTWTIIDPGDLSRQTRHDVIGECFGELLQFR
jgi:hypothetical protein